MCLPTEQSSTPNVRQHLGDTCDPFRLRNGQKSAAHRRKDSYRGNKCRSRLSGGRVTRARKEGRRRQKSVRQDKSYRPSRRRNLLEFPSLWARRSHQDIEREKVPAVFSDWMVAIIIKSSARLRGARTRRARGQVCIRRTITVFFMIQPEAFFMVMETVPGRDLCPYTVHCDGECTSYMIIKNSSV